MKIELKNVTKEFDKVEIIKNISLEFETGKIYGLYGRNGSGKSVLMKLICGFLIPTKGKVLINGKDFNAKNELRIHHFVSDSNEGTENPAGKFGEALEKLVYWCEENNVTNTLGLQEFYKSYNSGKYPGLGTVKKYSIMHHIELMNDFLEGDQ